MPTVVPRAFSSQFRTLRERNPALLALIEQRLGLSLLPPKPPTPARRTVTPAPSSEPEPSVAPGPGLGLRPGLGLASVPSMRDSDAFEAVRSETEGIGIAKSTPVITAPGWNEGGSSFGDLRPRKSSFSGAVLRPRRPRRIGAKEFSGGGPIPDVLDLIGGEVLNVIDGTDNVIDGTDNVVD